MVRLSWLLPSCVTGSQNSATRANSWVSSIVYRRKGEREKAFTLPFSRSPVELQPQNRRGDVLGAEHLALQEPW